MANNTLTPFPMLELELPDIPPRSQLYPLEPIGLGTVQVESLTSYLIRLANAHCVSVNKLAQLEFAAVLNKPEKHTFANFTKKTLNGTAGWTELTIEALEILTHRHDIRFLTMYPWRSALARTKLLRYHLAWCPTCYHQWRQSGQTIYHPLLWALDVVQICPRHQQSLNHHCPHTDCQRRLPLVNNKGKLGYCPFCHRWLGSEPGAASENTWDESELNWQIWVTARVEEMLTAAQNESFELQRHLVIENIKAWLKAAVSRSVQKLADDIGVPSSRLFGWMTYDSLPELGLLTRVCYHLDLTLLDILTTQPDLQLHFGQSDGDNPVRFNPQNWGKQKIEVNALRHELEQFLNNPQTSPCPAYQVAQQLGVSHATIRDLCPEQYQQIVEQYRHYQQTQHQLKNEKLASDLKAFLDSEEIPPPSLSEAARRLQIHRTTAQWICPELCRLISEKYKTYHQTRKLKVEMDLKELLAANETPPPSMTETAARLGEKTDYLYYHFPTLCRTVVQRCRTYQQSKIDQPPIDNQPQEPHQLGDQIRLIIAAEEKPPPSRTEVARRLNCSLSFLRYHHPDLCQQLQQQLEVYRQTRKSTLERKLHDILAENESPPPSSYQVANRLGVERTILRRQTPQLYAEIVRRHQTYQQAEKQKRKAFLDQVLAENALPPPSLSQVARDLNCNVSILHDQFPETNRAIVNRNQAYKQEKKAAIKATLQAALTDQQNPPPSLIQLARQLGYENIDILRNHFPDLCHQIHQRYQISRQQIARAKLEAVLAASPDPPPTLKDISRQLGYSANGLKRLWPDLCQAILEKRQHYQDGRKLALEQALKAVLEDEQTPPMSLKKIAAQFGFAPHTVSKYFPDLAAAVSEKYKAYRSQKAQQRQQRLAEEVKSITRQLHHEGVDPTLRQLTLRLPYPKMIFMPYIRDAWREARQELGLPT